MDVASQTVAERATASIGCRRVPPGQREHGQTTRDGEKSESKETGQRLSELRGKRWPMAPRGKKVEGKSKEERRRSRSGGGRAERESWQDTAVGSSRGGRNLGRFGWARNSSEGQARQDSPGPDRLDRRGDRLSGRRCAGASDPTLSGCGASAEA